MSRRARTDAGSPPVAFASGPVLVTGASGFIGSHLVERLAAAGVAVRCLSRRGAPGWGPGEIVRGDVRDPSSVQAAMRGVRTVFHLAGVSSRAASSADPHAAFLVNLLGTQHVLESARLAGVARVVLLSTAQVFGAAQALPVTESHPLAPASPYAASKLAADVLAEGYRRGFGVAVAILRSFNVYGPRQSTAAVIPTIISETLAGGPIRLRSLAPRRDYVYVADVVDALLRAGAVEPVPELPLIVASGRAVAVRELVRRVQAIVGRVPGPFAARCRSDGETDCIYGDAAEARAQLGWVPRVGLDEGLARTVEWWRAQPNPRTLHRAAVEAPE